jgi:hypothetical protein
MNIYPSPWEIEKADFEEYWMPGKHYNVGPARAINNIEDARLIAAAPDLLAALKLAAEINPYGSVENAAVRDAARAAIAKATGEQQ